MLCEAEVGLTMLSGLLRSALAPTSTAIALSASLAAAQIAGVLPSYSAGPVGWETEISCQGYQHFAALRGWDGPVAGRWAGDGFRVRVRTSIRLWLGSKISIVLDYGWSVMIEVLWLYI